MIVLVVYIEVLIAEAYTLKARRSVLNSLKDRLRNKFHVSIAEVGGASKLNYAELGVSFVTNEMKIAENVYGKILSMLDDEHTIEIVRIEKEYIG